MKLPRISIGWMMFAVAMICVPLGLLQHTLHGHPLSGEIGLWPTLIAFGTSSYRIANYRGRVSPFLWGFTTAGWSSVPIYLAIAQWSPWLLAMPLRYYFIMVDRMVDVWWIASLTDSGRYQFFVLNLLVQGLILSVPQFIMATVGGLIARGIWWKRWNTTSS